MEAAAKGIAAADGMGVPTVKPWNLDTIREKFALVEQSGCFAVAMDVDAAGLPVALPGIDFVRVYTGVNQYCGWIGETSTEITRAADLHIQ